MDSVLECTWKILKPSDWSQDAVTLIVKVGYLSWPWILPTNIASRRKKVICVFFGKQLSVWSFQHLYCLDTGTKHSGNGFGSVGTLHSSTKTKQTKGLTFNGSCHHPPLSWLSLQSAMSIWLNSDLWGFTTILQYQNWLVLSTPLRNIYNYDFVPAEWKLSKSFCKPITGSWSHRFT